MKLEKLEEIKERNEHRREIKAKASPGPWIAGAVYMSAPVHEGDESYIGDRWVYEGDCYLCAGATGVEKLIMKQYVEDDATYHLHLVKEEVFREEDLSPTVVSAAGFRPIAAQEKIHNFYQWPGKGEDGLASGIDDATFIAHARNDDVEADVDGLILEVEVLRAHAERLEEQVQRLVRQLPKDEREEPDIPF